MSAIADRASKVSHQIETGRWHRAHCASVSAPNASRVGGSRQNMYRDAAQDLRPEHLVEIGDAALKRAATESKREQAEPRRRQPAGIKPAFQVCLQSARSLVARRR